MRKINDSKRDKNKITLISSLELANASFPRDKTLK
jgi:hypothetical protein